MTCELLCRSACSCKRRGAFTPTIAEEKLSTAAKNKSTQVLYESDTLLAQVLATHYGDASHVFAPLSGEGGILNLATSFHARLAGMVACPTWLGSVSTFACNSNQPNSLVLRGLCIHHLPEHVVD
jgi:hypothetical protein